MMILRRRCFTQTSVRVFCLNPQCPAYHLPNDRRRRSIHPSLPRQQNDDEENIFDVEDRKEDPDEEKGLKDLYTAGGKDLQGKGGEEEEGGQSRRSPQTKKETERDDDRSGRLTSLTELDASMDDEDLGLKGMRRKAKVDFRRWLIQQAPFFRNYPQHLLQDIEARRVDKLRKGSEDRMFARMNTFYKSLTLEEILAGKLAMKTDKKGRILPNQKRPQQPEPTPFQQVMTGEILLDISAKEFESRVLALMARYDSGLSTLYKNYIDWSDYQLQKQKLWFRFPVNPIYKDVVARLGALQPAQEVKPKSEEEGVEEEQKELQREEEEPENQLDESGNPMPSEEPPIDTVSPHENEVEAISTSESADVTTASSSTEMPTETSGASEQAESETPTSDDSSTIAERNAVQSTAPVPAYKVEPVDSPGVDLATYTGPRVGSTIGFPFLPIPASHYANPDHRSPFPHNPRFRPWRPISHSTRLRMFDAWREGLGLRNIAWIGGVSWRRADGIIGIMKREWQFVKEGGELEEEMALYVEKLLAETPVPGKAPGTGKEVFVKRDTFRELAFFGQPNLSRFPDAQNEPKGDPAKSAAEAIHPEPGQLYAKPEPLADPAPQIVSAQYRIGEQRCPEPEIPIFMLSQRTLDQAVRDTETRVDRARRLNYVGLLLQNQEYDRHYREWEARQKEPIVEIPIRRTKQYFAIAQEMEEYSEKRAAQALGGIGGRTMTEKEEGIKLFLSKFGGLRSLGDRDRYQGTPPWKRRYGIRQRLLLKKAVRKAKFKNPKERVLERIKKEGKKQSEKGERVIWKFEDVSWVKQRTARPRKRSYVGLLDQRARLESGVRRYGPHGIGSGGIEGVGGIKKIISRGLDGQIQLEDGPKARSGKKREIVV